MLHDIAIVIPSYKPEEGIVTLINDLCQHFAKIVVVDDGSGPEYKARFEELRNRGATVLTHAVNQGKGRALKTAFNYFCVEHPNMGVITVDGDGQHRVKDVVAVADMMKKKPEDMILGCRVFKDKSIPFRSRFGNSFSRITYKWMCGLRVSDTQTGLRGIPSMYLPVCCRIVGEKYEYETNMLLAFKDHGVGISEIGIETIYENNNQSSHFRPLKDSARIYAVIFKYAASSLITSICDYVVFVALLACRVSVLPATYGARVVASIVNFTINKNIVFKNNEKRLSQFLKYMVLVFVSGTIAGCTVTILTSATGFVSPALIKIPVEVVLFFFNYVVQRKFIFNRRTSGE